MEAILDTIGTVLNRREVLQCNLEEKLRIVEEQFRRNVCLLVLDNFDSALLPENFVAQVVDFVRQLPPPQRVIVTLRMDQSWEGMHTVRLKRMGSDEARMLLLGEAELRQLPMLTDEEFDITFKRTAGNPLAMKQAMGLMRVMGYACDAALDFAEYSPRMLTFMYEKAYSRLPEDAKKVLVLLPLFATDASSEALEYGAELPWAFSIDPS
jgi:hypothetical protein